MKWVANTETIAIDNAASSPSAALLNNCVIGIGSFHGDDRAGWQVIDQLCLQLTELSPVCLRKAAVPHDVLDWLHPQLHLHLVDACDADVAGVQRLEVLFHGPAHAPDSPVSSEDWDAAKQERWMLPDCQVSRRLSALRSRSTHQFDLLSTLELASALGKLPPRFTLWTIAIESAEKNAELSPAVHGRVLECAARIELELIHA